MKLIPTTRPAPDNSPHQFPTLVGRAIFGAPIQADNFPHPLRTLVVDDSVVFLERLSAYLKTQPLFQVVGTAMNGSEALHMAEWLGPDLVFMDLRMPFMDGLQATAILRRRAPNIRIIIMTMEDSATAEAEAQAHGAHGFISKPRIIHDHLITAVRRAFHSDHSNDERSGL
jgi:DNA-binding NarL/FixJ family response regulator